MAVDSNQRKSRDSAVPLAIYAVGVALLLIVVMLVVFRDPIWSFVLGNWGVLTFLSGWVSFGIKVAYERKYSLYLGFQKLRSWLFNVSAYWDLTASYRGAFDQDDLDQLASRLTPLAEKTRRISDRATVYEFRFFAMELRGFTDTSGQTSIEAGIFRMNVPYRDALHRLRHEIRPVLTAIEDTLKPDNRQYWLTVHYAQLNPFYGAYVARLALKQVESFNLVFCLDGDTVQVTKDRMSVKADSIAQFGDLVARHLALTGNPL